MNLTQEELCVTSVGPTRQLLVYEACPQGGGLFRFNDS